MFSYSTKLLTASLKNYNQLILKIVRFAIQYIYREKE